MGRQKASQCAGAGLANGSAVFGFGSVLTAAVAGTATAGWGLVPEHQPATSSPLVDPSGCCCVVTHLAKPENTNTALGRSKQRHIPTPRLTNHAPDLSTMSTQSLPCRYAIVTHRAWPDSGSVHSIFSFWARKRWKKGPRVLFGRRLAQVRKQKGLVARKLALESGIARSYLGGVERAVEHCTTINICKLAGDFAGPCHELFVFDQTDS